MRIYLASTSYNGYRNYPMITKILRDIALITLADRQTDRQTDHGIVKTTRAVCDNIFPIQNSCN